jgi:tetratricopeptide (TPR) repeat protein
MFFDFNNWSASDCMEKSNLEYSVIYYENGLDFFQENSFFLALSRFNISYNLSPKPECYNMLKRSLARTLISFKQGDRSIIKEVDKNVQILFSVAELIESREGIVEEFNEEFVDKYINRWKLFIKGENETFQKTEDDKYPLRQLVTLIEAGNIDEATEHFNILVKNDNTFRSEYSSFEDFNKSIIQNGIDHWNQVNSAKVQDEIRDHTQRAKVSNSVGFKVENDEIRSIRHYENGVLQEKEGNLLRAREEYLVAIRMYKNDSYILALNRVMKEIQKNNALLERMRMFELPGSRHKYE